MTRARNTGDTVSPAYIDQLRQRVERGPGVLSVAREAGLSRVTVWRMLSHGGDRPQLVNLDSIRRIRDALAVLDPSAGEMPPPVVSVRDMTHHGWIALADELRADELAELVANKARTLEALRATLSASTKRRK